MHLTIKNDGQRIVETNYWETELAKEGFIYCSINAGALRVLVSPAHHLQFLLAILVVDIVTASFGPVQAGAISKEFGRSDAFPPNDIPMGMQLLWHQAPSDRNVVILRPEQFDRLPPIQDHGRYCPCTVWLPDPQDGTPKCYRQHVAVIRRSAKLPEIRSFWEIGK